MGMLSKKWAKITVRYGFRKRVYGIFDYQFQDAFDQCLLLQKEMINDGSYAPGLQWASEIRSFE